MGIAGPWNGGRARARPAEVRVPGRRATLVAARSVRRHPRGGAWLSDRHPAMAMSPALRFVSGGSPRAAPSSLHALCSERDSEPHVAWLSMAPVKAMALVALDTADIGPRGIPGDRRFAVVDETGRLINGKRLGRLATIVPTVTRGRDPPRTSLSGRELRRGARGTGRSDRGALLRQAPPGPSPRRAIRPRACAPGGPAAPPGTGR